jgi:hypothetical protein
MVRIARRRAYPPSRGQDEIDLAAAAAFVAGFV